MSYYYEKKIHEIYKISELFNTNTTLIKNTIEICNNENFVLDLSQSLFKSNIKGVENVELNKVIIDWGDGETSKLTRPINHSISTISNVKKDDWKKTTHLFNVTKRNIYLTNDVSFLPKIKIKMYSTFNDMVTVIIPYKVIYKSLYDLGTNFELLQANVANNNLTQFVLKEGVNDSITIVSVKDWKKIYGDESDINFIDDNNISIDYSDEYVDVDNIVWEWNSIPYVTVEDLKVDTTNKTITGSFIEKNVIVDTWKTNCEKILDTGNESCNLSKKDETKPNAFLCSFDGDMTNSLFGVYLTMTGINGVTGNSDYFYVASSDIFAKSITQLTATTTVSPYTFNLNRGVQWKHFETAKMILKPIRWAASKSMYSNDVVDIGLETEVYEDSDVSYSFEYIITNNGVTIDPYSLPNGNYSVSYYIKDLLGNVNQSVPLNGVTEHKISIDDIPSPDFDDFSTTDEMIDIKWHVESEKQDKTTLKIINLRNNDIVSNIKEPYNKNGLIKHSIDMNNENRHYYSYSIDGNIIPDGCYEIKIGNCIDMTNFVGCRQKASTTYIQYKYPSPKININSINTYPKWNATIKKWIPYFRFNLTKSDKTIKNLKIIYGTDDEFKYELSQSTIYEIPISELSQLGINNNECKISASFDSDSYNRLGYGTSYTIINNKQIDELFTNIPAWSEDLLDLSKYYINNKTNVGDIAGTTIQQESAFDVNKKYAIVYDGETFYSPIESPKYYTTGDKQIWYVYRPIEYREKISSDKVTRFYNDGGIIIGANDSIPTVTELPTVKTYLDGKNITKTTSYNMNNDTSNITFGCVDNKLAEEKEIQYGFLELYTPEGVQVFRQDIRKHFNYTASSLTPGVYTGRILFSSLKTSNVAGTTDSTLENITYDLGKIEALVPASSALSASASSSKNVNNTNYYDVTISYTIHHKQFESLKLVYKIGSGSDITVPLNSISSSSYELPEQIAPDTNVTYYFTAKSSFIKNGNSSAGVKVGNASYTYTTPSL